MDQEEVKYTEDGRQVDFSNIYVNQDNTPLEDLKLNTYPIEVQEQFMDFICNVPYIKECISINKPRACDLPRDEQGRIIVRIGQVHHLENMDYFRQTAIHYQKTGKLTDYRVNSNPNSDYGRWFKEEIRRCWEGMVRPEDGEWITGDMYFFLNYCPIMQSKTKVGSKKALRVWDFPEVWEGHYYKFHYIEQARNSGLHGAELASRGKGKAHPYSQKVYTPDGLKTWGEIQIGSQLIGDDGEITTVIDIPFDDVCDVYKITLKDGREVYASENHLWKVIKRHSKQNSVRICSTKQIQDNLFYNRHVNYRNPNGREYIYGIIGNSGVNCWKEKEVSISPYTMGLIIGNGCFRNKDLANNVYFTSSYEDMITYESIVPYNIKHLKTDKEFFINIPNVKYKLQEYGLYMLKSEDKFIPDDYKFNSRRVRLDILKGLMDSDGTVTNGIPVLSTASKRLADDVAFIARSLGYNCVIRTKRNRGYRKNNQFIKCLDAYEVRIFTNDKIFNLKRKYEKLTDFSSKYSRSNKESTTIVDIQFSHRERCKCVTVDNESNCYLVGDFVTTHNSYSLAALLAKRFILGENKETTKEVKCLVTAYQKEYLNRDGVLNKFQSYIDFCSDNTQFPNKKLKNSLNDMNWTMGYFDLDTQTRKGTLNEVLGVSSKDDDSKLRGKRAALIGIEEFGCHIAGTQVLMYDNTIKNVEDIKKGDLLLGIDGTERKVLQCHSGMDQMYKITLSNGDWQIVNSKHLVRYIKHNWNNNTDSEELKTAVELIDKNLDGCYIEKANIDYQHKDVYIDPYFLGLWLGDGDSSRLDIANEDEEVLDWLNENYDGYTRNLKQSDTCKVFHISKSNELDKYFKLYKLYNNKYIPTDYIYNSRDVHLQLIAGLIDTDGTYVKTKHADYFEITQRYNRKHILDVVKFIATNLGLRCVMTTRVSSDKSKKPGVLHYRLRISGNIDIIPTKIKRKQAQKRVVKYKQRRNWNYYTFKIEPYSIDRYYGFTIDKDNLFILKDGTIVHNSFPNLLGLYGTLRPGMEEGDYAFGLIWLQGCVCAGTKVQLPNGQPINIEDVNKGDKLLGYDCNRSSVENISWLQPYAEKECVRICTEKNNYIECSIDHPILAINKNKYNKHLGTCSFYRANELNIGDTLLMPRKVGRFGKVHEDNAYLLGNLFGDGSYSDNSCVTMSITTEEEYEYWDSKYDINISKLKDGYAQIYFRKIHSLLKKYKMDKQSFENKKLPYNIFDWDKESLCNFLGGYFNADGNVQIIKQKHRSIKLTCKYENILIQIKYLLLKLGISAHIYKEHKRERILKSNVNNRSYTMRENDVYVLYISNSIDIQIFKQNIRFIIKSKQDRLDSYTYEFKHGIVDKIKFKLRDNGKGKNFDGKYFYDLQKVSIKSIEYLGVKRIYNMTADTTHTYISNGFISSNTAGDKSSDFHAAETLMYQPIGYHLYPVQNVYDKIGQGRKHFVYFFPGFINRKGCYDHDGNSDVTKAILEILVERYIIKHNATDVNAISKAISEIPITPQEAIIKAEGCLFPIAQLTERLNQIDGNPSEYDDVYVGSLVQNSNGEVEYLPTNETPIHIFPTKDNKLSGAIEIFQMPQKNRDGKVQPNRYIIGYDPVAADQADTMSLASVFVLDLFTDQLVAEYTGRQIYEDQNHEIVRLMCLFYNAKCMYENNIKGCYAYFAKMNCLHLLADTPEYLRDKQLVKTVGWGNTSKGIRASKPINGFGDQLIKDWLLKPVPKVVKDEDGNDKEIAVPNLYLIRNRALLEELIQYNPYINVDRIRALSSLMLYREEKIIIYQGKMKQDEDDYDASYLGNDDFFTRNYNKKQSFLKY